MPKSALPFDANVLSYPLDEGLTMIGMSRPSGYQLMKAGKLRTFMAAGKRRVTPTALLACVALLEEETAKQDAKGIVGTGAARKKAPPLTTVPFDLLPEPVGYRAPRARRRSGTADEPAVVS